jgi:hypothetical protein
MNEENLENKIDTVCWDDEVSSVSCTIDTTTSTLSSMSTSKSFNGKELDGFTCLFADEKNHRRDTQRAGRRPFADQRMTPTGDLVPRFCIAPDTNGKIALVNVRDEDPRKVQGLIKSGKAYPVPVASEGACYSFMKKSGVSKDQLKVLKDLEKKLVGNGDNLYHAVHRDYPMISWGPAKFIYYPDAEYPWNLIRRTPDEGKFCSSFLLVKNLVDGGPELIRGYYFSPHYITEMAANRDAIAVPENLTVYLKEVLEMKAMGGVRTYREACFALTDIKRNFPEGKFVEVHHLCQLRKLLNGKRVIY